MLLRKRELLNQLLYLVDESQEVMCYQEVISEFIYVFNANSRYAENLLNKLTQLFQVPCSVTDPNRTEYRRFSPNCRKTTERSFKIEQENEASEIISTVNIKGHFKNRENNGKKFSLVFPPQYNELSLENVFTLLFLSLQVKPCFLLVSVELN